MRFSKSGTALAIILAVTVFGGHAAYAESTQSVVVARDPSAAQDTSVKTDASATVDVTIQPGDTLSQLADKYQTTIDEIVQLNAITDPNVINVGASLRIPGNGDTTTTQAAEYDQLKAAATAFITPPAPVAPTYQAAATSRNTAPRPSAGYAGGSTGNTYAWGNCTWYVKERKPNIPNMLGNGGYGWLTTAAAAGYSTGSVPVAGAIGVESGHVVIIESVNGNGTVNISEMNYAGGVGVVHYRTTPASEFMYIYA